MSKEYKNFKLVKKNINTSIFLKELGRFLVNKDWSTARSDYAYEQKNTRNINLRIHVLTTEHPEVSESPLSKIVAENYLAFQKTYTFLESFADGLNGQLGRAMIVTLKPNSQVYRHYDKGSYYEGRDRYHLVLRSSGSRMVCGDEQSVWKEGELWWFNNKLEHEAFNESSEERVHIIFDILPEKRSLPQKLQSYLVKKYISLKE